MSGGGAAAEPGWGERIRRAPAGVLVLGALLFLLGAVLVLSGAYLALARSDTGVVPWAAALLLGPVLFYVAMHLVRLTPWAWLAMVLLLGMLLASSVVRAVASPREPLSALAEVAVEAGFLAYLARRPVRRAFGRA